MILVLAGTADAREVIARVKVATDQRVAASAVTTYGARLAREAGADLVQEGAMDGEELISFLKQEGIRVVIDATHPFATGITAAARRACRYLGLPYFRYRRPPVPLPSHPALLLAAGYDEAVALAARGEVIFLTTGTRHLERFTAAPALAGKRIVARVLPEEASLARCRSLGLLPKDIVAIQGPCSYELNQALYRQFNADVLVTKDSGTTGGVTAKIQAALDLGMTAVVLRRPPEPDSLPLEQIIPALIKAGAT